jgi:DNA-binding MarR family transcriptional regulator
MAAANRSWVVSLNMSDAANEELPLRAERLVLQLASLGNGVSAAMAASTGEPDLVGNAPLQVMCLLDLDGPTRPSAITEVVGLTSGGTTKLLDRLETAGMIERSYGVIEDDHRGVQVSLTDEGRQMVRTAASALVDHLPDVSDLVKSVVVLLDTLRTA